MAKRTATIDPSRVNLIFGGVPITGFPDGTFISVEYDEDHFTKETGVDLTTRVATNNYDATLTITLKQASASNDYLSSISELDRRQLAGVLPLLLKDSAGRTTLGSSAAWIRRNPTLAFAKGQSENREWVLDVVDFVGLIGGNEDLLD
jgi:hypothetical protein